MTRRSRPAGREPGPHSATRPTVDPVTAEVVRGAMETICFEMADLRVAHRDDADPQPVATSATRRSSTRRAGSPRCRSASRSSCSRRRCRCASRSSSSASTSSARATCSSPTTRTTAAATSPTTTCSRRSSPTSPTATGGRRMVLIASIQCHHGDTGGGVPGGYNVTATDIWGEGVRWPVVKVIDRGVERRDVLYALQANNRIPSYIGDLRAQIGAAQLAAQRLGEMHRPLRRRRRRGVASTTMIDYAAQPLPRGGRGVARRRVRGRRVRRPRPARQPRRAPAREDHRRRRRTSRSTSPAATRARSSRRGRRSATRAGTRSGRSPR